MFKLQVQEDDDHADVWHDVKNAQGALLTFETDTEARAKLAELYPVLVQLEKFASGSKRTRVLKLNPYQDKDDEKDWKQK